MPVYRLSILLSLVFFLIANVVWSQSTGYKDHLQLANRFASEGNYFASAEQYEKAFAEKPKKTAHAYQAASYFYLVKDYARASKLFSIVANDYADYPLAGLNYARCLKQQGKFAEASKAFLSYLEGYKLSDRKIIEQIVATEIKGAELALQENSRYNGELVVEALSNGVNSSSNEFGPMPLAATALYYISDQNGLTRLFRSNLEGANWSKGELANQFPFITGKHIGSGMLSPSNDRFYFSICDATEFMGRPTAQCQLYVIVKVADNWGTPQALPAYINTPGNSTTTPFVYQQGDVEVMLFSRDRLDGYGGMDLYRSERYLSSDGTDFSFPENLGPVVNSVGDEVTPYYDPESQTLFFSSNGLISFGGFDVFKTRGNKTSWNTPENLKSPINSAADDYYYRSFGDTKAAFFTSNRSVDKAKTRTSNEDIFLVRPGTPTFAVSLQVVDSATNNPLSGVALAAYATTSDANRRLIFSEMTNDGYFKLDLPLGAEVEFDVQRLDYRRVVEKIRVPKQVLEGYQLPRIRLVRIATPLVEIQENERSRKDSPIASIPAQVAPTRPKASTQGTSATASSTSIPSGSVRVSSSSSAANSSGQQASTSATDATAGRVDRQASNASNFRLTTTGRSYRIQIEARDRFDPSHSRYDNIRDLGILSENYIESKGLYRVLVGSYTSRVDAENVLAKIRAAGWNNAFIAAYRDDKYLGLSGK